MRLSLSADEAVARLRSALADHGPELTATISGRYVVLRVAESRQHFGSPQLSFEIEDQASGSSINGLFMPLPSIWTGFMALYGLIVFGGFSGTIYGLAQWQIGNAPHACWSIPIAGLLLACVHLAAGIGKKMGSSQMRQLQQFAERSLLKKS